MYTGKVTLISKQQADTDSIGQPVYEDVTRDVFAQENKVGSREYYNAVAVGLRPEIELQMRKSNYSGEKTLIYQDTVYTVIRKINKSVFDVVLVCQVKDG